MQIRFAVSCVATTSFLLSVAYSQPSAAQVNLQVQIGVPTIRFETAPALVEVSPGVQVVPEYEQEVFFVDGWYWHRAGRMWYRTQDHRGGWVAVQRREVPRGLVRIPPGRYRHYRAEGPRRIEPRREMPPGHRGQAQFQRRDHREQVEPRRFEHNNHSDHQERRNHKEQDDSHRGHR